MARTPYIDSEFRTEDYLFPHRKEVGRIRRYLRGKNPVVGGTVSSSNGTVGMFIDYSPAVMGVKLTGAMIETIRAALTDEYEGAFLEQFRDLVLKTPVYRGTARLNWKVQIGERVATYKTSRGSFGGGYMNVKDPEISPPANKLGQIRAGNRYIISNSKKVLTKNPKMVGKPIANGTKKNGEIRTSGRRTRIGELTQREFGIETSAVEKLVENVAKLINNKSTGFGKVKGRIKGNRKLKQIVVYNETPYLKFLEGVGRHGARYTGGSQIYESKIGSNKSAKFNEDLRPTGTFVNMLRESDGEFDMYEPGFIGASYSRMRSLSRILSQTMLKSFLPEYKQKKRWDKTTEAGLEEFKTFRANYMKRYRRGQVGNYMGVRPMTKKEKDKYKKEREERFTAMLKKRSEVRADKEREVIRMIEENVEVTRLSLDEIKTMMFRLSSKNENHLIPQQVPPLKRFEWWKRLGEERDKRNAASRERSNQNLKRSVKKALESKPEPPIKNKPTGTTLKKGGVRKALGKRRDLFTE